VRIFIAFCAIALSACVGRAIAAPEEEVLTPSDFAYGREIKLPESSLPVVSVALPVDLYRAMRAPDLSELMVFNGRGAQVPHAIRTVKTGSPAAAETLDLPLFPLHAVVPAGSAASSLALEIERDSDGHVLRIAAKSGTGENAKPDRKSKRPDPPVADGGAADLESLPPIAAYILDARAAKRPIVSLRVKLEEFADERVLPLSVATSDDLVRFVDVAVDGALIQLGHGGQRIDRDQITIQPTRAEFFRVSAAREGNFPVRIAHVIATLADVEPTRPFEKVTAVAQTTPKPQVFDFDLGGPVPVDRVEVQLPENNTIVNAELFVSSSAKGQWHPLLRTRLYRIARTEAELAGPMLEIARSNARYYELRVEATGGGLGAGKPTLVTYHAPDQLLFLRRGEGPFTLAYGRYKVERSRFEADDLLSLLPDQPAPTASGELGEVKTLGGKERLAAPKQPPPYKTYAVWAVLIAGVALLGVIALRLARSSKPTS
jgi:hypothetical protein